MKKLFLIFGLISVLLFGGADLSNMSPGETIQLTFFSLGKLLKEKPNVTNTEIRSLLEPVFDMSEISKRSLGSYWTRFNEEQQKEFIKSFSNLLFKSYITKIRKANTSNIEIVDEIGNEERAIVQTKISQRSDSYLIEYKMQKKDRLWKIYDLVIEHIGLTSNYRNEFGGMIRKMGVEEFLKTIKEKSV